MPWPQSENSGPTLRKSQRPCRQPQNCLARRLLTGGVPGPWVVVERFIEVIYTFTALQNSQKRRKNGRFRDVLVYKSPKTFFALKYLTRYTHETFFERYTKFEAHYLSRCIDIPLQSFGSHIRPQPHGLGLKGPSEITIIRYSFNDILQSFKM